MNSSPNWCSMSPEFRNLSYAGHTLLARIFEQTLQRSIVGSFMHACALYFINLTFGTWRGFSDEGWPIYLISNSTMNDDPRRECFKYISVALELTWMCWNISVIFRWMEKTKIRRTAINNKIQAISRSGSNDNNYFAINVRMSCFDVLGREKILLSSFVNYSFLSISHETLDHWKIAHFQKQDERQNDAEQQQRRQQQKETIINNKSE